MLHVQEALSVPLKDDRALFALWIGHTEYTNIIDDPIFCIISRRHIRTHIDTLGNPIRELIGKDLITLASMFRIPVTLHNIEDKDIWRPHAWSAFGTKDLEGADFRACANYKELYK